VKEQQLSALALSWEVVQAGFVDHTHVATALVFGDSVKMHVVDGRTAARRAKAAVSHSVILNTNFRSSAMHILEVVWC